MWNSLEIHFGGHVAAGIEDPHAPSAALIWVDSAKAFSWPSDSCSCLQPESTNEALTFHHDLCSQWYHYVSACISLCARPLAGSVMVRAPQIEVKQSLQSSSTFPTPGIIYIYIVYIHIVLYYIIYIYLYIYLSPKNRCFSVSSENMTQKNASSR